MPCEALAHNPKSSEFTKSDLFITLDLKHFFSVVVRDRHLEISKGLLKGRGHVSCSFLSTFTQQVYPLINMFFLQIRNTHYPALYLSTEGLVKEPFHKWFCGTSSQSVEVSKQVQDYTKRSTVCDGAVREHMAKSRKIQVHLTLQWLNRFVNGFVERLRGV